MIAASENHLVVRVSDLRSPLKSNVHRDEQSREFVQEVVNLIDVQAVDCDVFGPFENVLIFEEEWRGAEQKHVAHSGFSEESVVRASSAAKSGDHDGGVEHDAQHDEADDS